MVPTRDIRRNRSEKMQGQSAGDSGLTIKVLTEAVSIPLTRAIKKDGTAKRSL
jgi:hypothetical protein